MSCFVDRARRGSFVVECTFVNYLTGRVDLAEHEIRIAQPARREDGGRDYAVGLTGACAQKMAPELRDRAGRPLGPLGRLPFRDQRLRERQEKKPGTAVFGKIVD